MEKNTLRKKIRGALKLANFVDVKNPYLSFGES